MVKNEDNEEEIIDNDPVNGRMDPDSKLTDLADDLLDKYPKKEEVKNEQAESEEESEAEKEESKEEEKPTEEQAEGYYADEGEEEELDEEEEPAPARVAEAIKDRWERLSPLERYLAENIQPLQITGIYKGKETTLSVYAIENIPEDFEFATRGQERVAISALNRMEIKANELTQQFNNNEQLANNEKFREQENRDIRMDIAKLQRAGEIPLGTPGKSPDDDPNLQIARDVLAYYEAENVKRLEESNKTGRLFNRLSFEDAYWLWKRENGKVSRSQQQEDKERVDITRRAARGQRQGAANKDTRRLNLPRTASWDDVINGILGG